MTPPLDHERALAPLGRFHAWWRGKPLPPLPSLADLTIAPAHDVRLLAVLTAQDSVEIERRLAEGHVPWMAWSGEEPVAWGWCATRELSIGELGIACALPPRERYLWDFFTIPRWRGRGIYPRLLLAIVASEPEVERFWVGHDFGNTASARGIAKAGFREVGVLYRQVDGAFVLAPSGPLDVAVAAAELFGIPNVAALAIETT